VQEVREIVNNYPEEVYVDHNQTRYGVASDFALRAHLVDHEELERDEDLFWFWLEESVKDFPELEKPFPLGLFLKPQTKKAEVEATKYFAPKRKDRSGFIILKILNGQIRRREKEKEGNGNWSKNEKEIDQKAGW
jgi:hypothetical protein